MSSQFKQTEEEREKRRNERKRTASNPETPRITPSFEAAKTPQRIHEQAAVASKSPAGRFLVRREKTREEAARRVLSRNAEEGESFGQGWTLRRERKREEGEKGGEKELTKLKQQPTSFPVLLSSRRRE